MSARLLIYSFKKLMSTTAFSKVEVPRRYNFVRDHMEVLVCEEQISGKKKLAYWWADSAGNEVRLSYSDIVERSKIAANGLLNQGLNPGDRVLLLLPRVPEWWLLLLACIRSGIVAIPATIMLSEKDIKYRLETARPKIVFTVPESASKIEKAISGTSFRCLKVVCPQPSCSSLVQSDWITLDDLTRKANSKHICIDSSIEDTMMCYFTSGTTGMPKMVELTHGFALGQRFSTTPFIGSKPGQVAWIYADPGWVATLYGAVFPPWYLQNTVFSHYTPSSAAIWSRIFEILKKYPVNVFIAPPTVYRMLLHEKQIPKREELPHLVDCLTGGEALNSETFLAWKNKLGFEIREIYGQTETPGLIGNLPGSKVKPGSFGKELGFDIRLLDDDLKEVGTGGEGHIAVKYGETRPFLFKQYIGSPEATGKAFRDGYYFTGDKARRDSDGYLYFTSRSDDVILSSGYRIGPFEVESALLDHPAVLESAAVASPCKERGEVVKSFVVLKDEFKGCDLKKLASEIQEVVKKATAPYKYPRRIEFVDELPKTISGKIKRAELRRKEFANQK